MKSRHEDGEGTEEGEKRGNVKDKRAEKGREKRKREDELRRQGRE